MLLVVNMHTNMRVCGEEKKIDLYLDDYLSWSLPRRQKQYGNGTETVWTIA
jgi:hypothetical protein